MSKTLEPIAFAIAIEPWPFFATVTEAMRSGTDVPAARTMTPMMTGSTRQEQPIIEARYTMPVQRAPIQMTHIEKETMYLIGGGEREFKRESGWVSNEKTSGEEQNRKEREKRERRTSS